MEIFQSTTVLVINVFENEEVQHITNQFCVERGWNIEDDRCQSVRNSLLEEERRMRKRGDGGEGARGAIRYNLNLENDVSVPFQVTQTMATVDGEAFLVPYSMGDRGGNMGETCFEKHALSNMLCEKYVFDC